MKKKLFNPNFSFLVLGQMFSLIGNFTLKFALSMYVLEQTGSAVVFAGMLTMAMLPTILLSPFGGILADRWNRRNIMVCLDTISCVIVFASGKLLTVYNDIVVISALLIVLSVLGAFESPTVQACVPQMQTNDNILKGNAVVNQVTAIASFITPFLGSIFYTAFGLKPVLYATVGCFFITAVFECFIKLDYEKPSEKKRMLAIVKYDFSVSIRFLFKEQRNILKLLLLAALVSFFLSGNVIVGFPYLVRTVLGLSAEHYGAAESAMGIAAILGGLSVSLLANKLKLDNLYIPLLILGLCLIPIGGVFLLSNNTFLKYLILTAMFCICQIACSIFSIYALSIILAKTPQYLTGKVMAFVTTISMCAQPLGQILYGFLFDAVSINVYMVLIPSGAVVCVIALLSVSFFRKMNDAEIEKNMSNVEM